MAKWTVNILTKNTLTDTHTHAKRQRRRECILRKCKLRDRKKIFIKSTYKCNFGPGFTLPREKARLPKQRYRQTIMTTKTVSLPCAKDIETANAYIFFNLDDLMYVHVQCSRCHLFSHADEC